MFDSVLIPTDGSEPAEWAVEIALGLAETHGATLRVLFIVDQPTSVSGMGEGFSGLDDLLDALEEKGHETTDAVAERAAERGVETTQQSVGGTPTESSRTRTTTTSMSSSWGPTAGRASNGCSSGA